MKPSISFFTSIGTWPDALEDRRVRASRLGRGPRRAAELHDRDDVRRIDRMCDEAPVAALQAFGEARGHDARRRRREHGVCAARPRRAWPQMAMLVLDHLWPALLHKVHTSNASPPAKQRCGCVSAAASGSLTRPCARQARASDSAMSLARRRAHPGRRPTPSRPSRRGRTRSPRHGRSVQRRQARQPAYVPPLLLKAAETSTRAPRCQGVSPADTSSTSLSDPRKVQLQFVRPKRAWVPDHFRIYIHAHAGPG